MGKPIVSGSLLNFQALSETENYFNVSYIRETVEKYGVADTDMTESKE